MLLALVLSPLAMVGPVWADPTAASTADVHIAEAGLPFIRNFDPSEFAANPQNCAIAQDGHGVMYFGNAQDGVLSFDGSHWRRIAILNHSAVRALAADASGRIYVGAVGELGYLEPDGSGRMHYVSLLDRIPQADRGFADVWKIFPTQDGVYFSTYTHIFRLRGKEVTVWKPATSFHMPFWARGTLYVREFDRGLMRLVGDRLVPVPGGERFAKEQIYALLPWGDPLSPSGDLLIGTLTQGWLVFDGTSYRAWVTEADAALKRDNIYGAMWLADGTLAVATLQGGVSLLDVHGRLLRHIDKASGLIDDGVNALFQDRQRGLWLALDAGIARIDLGSPLSRFDERQGLKGTVLALQRHAGHLYAGTLQGLFRLDTDSEGSGRFVQITQVPSGENWALLDLGSSLLVATASGVFEIGDNRIGVVRPSEQTALSLLRSKQNPARVFVGLPNGIASMRLENNRWVDEGQIPGVVAYSLTQFEDRDGRLWIGDRNGGVNRLTFPPGWSGGNDHIHPVRVERFGTEQGLPVGWTSVWAIDGAPRFTSGSGGIFEFDENRRRIVPDPRFAQLFPAGPRADWPMRQDADGRIWMSTSVASNGLNETGAVVQGRGRMYRWEPSPLQPLSGIKMEVIYGDSGGLFWLGGNKGVFRYDPGMHVVNDPQFAALVRNVTGRGDHPVAGGVGPSAVPQLAYADDALRFEFAAPSYDTLEANRFQVRLEGLDRDWSAWSSETYRDYTNLPEGDYRFRVRVRNVYGVVSAEASYAFGILPPWYRTWWAKLLLALVAVAAIATLVQSRTAYLRKRQRELERQVEARTAEVVHQKEIVELRKTEVEQQKAVAELAHRNISLLSDIGRLITASLDPEAIMDTLHQHVEKLMDASVFGIGLYDPENELIRIPYAMERGKRFAPYTRSMSEPNQLAVWCIRHRQEVFINDFAAESGRYTQDPGRTAAHQVLGTLQDGSSPNRPVAMIYAPLLVKDRVLGVISVQSFSAQAAYQPMHLDMLRTLAAYTAIALYNADASMQLKEAQKQLFQQESMASLGRLVAGVAHEINTPLGIGITAASHLEGLFESIDDMHGDSMPPVLREALASGRSCVELVLRNLGKADQLVRSFKQVAVDQSSEVRRRVAVRGYLDEVLMSLRSHLKKTPHRVEIDCPTDLEVDTFPGALYQIVANLVLNSLTHAFDNDSAGCIRIAVRRVGKSLDMTFADDGKGMADDVRQKVFEPFFTTRRGSGGMGLGLHLVYNLVTQLLGGTIACKSSPGQGTQFTLRLPLIASGVPEHSAT